MPLDQTLRRVDADLEHGRVLPAINRLRSLVREYPERLDVRFRLAEIYRSQGDLAQAGRWGYLAEDLDLTDLDAFERQFRTESRRIAALAWQGSTDTLGPRAKQRLQQLREAAAEETGRRLTADGRLVDAQSTASKVAEGLGCAAVVIAVILAVIGLGALVVHGAQVVMGWF
jgi:protein involved in temperature-dependent protein secretion